MKTKKLIYLSDYEILTYSKDNIITDYHDAILRGKSFRPVKFGVYDPDIFGSIFSNSCNCGRIRVPSDFPCPVCGSQLLDIATASKRFGRIELPVKYLSTLRETQYFRYVRGLFDSIQYDFHTTQFQPSFNRKVFDICQFDYDEENKSLIITDNITDNLKCSYEGLESIVNKYFGAGEYENLKKFTNYYVLVSPIPVRYPAVSFEGNRKVLVNDALTVSYQNILYVVQEYYKKTVGTLKTQFAIAMLNACLRRMVSNLLSNASEVLNTSKENITRNIQANRLQNSGRCTIVPAPDLKIDEVGIPRHLMYETCRDEFIQYMCDQWIIDKDEATVLWKDNATDQKLQDLFTEYIEGTGNGDCKYVIINRAPEHIMRVA